MSDSDSDCDDLFTSVLGSKAPSNTSAIVDGKRERKTIKRLIDEDLDDKEEDEFDLAKLASQSSKNAKKVAKMGFTSRLDAIENALDGGGVDWKFVDTVHKAAAAKKESMVTATPADDDGDGDDEEEGDFDGNIRNVYSGARVVLCVQGQLWPTVGSALVFNTACAQEELTSLKLSSSEGDEPLSFAVAEVERNLLAVFTTVETLSRNICSGAESVAEFLHRQPRGLPEVLTWIAAEALASLHACQGPPPPEGAPSPPPIKTTIRRNAFLASLLVHPRPLLPSVLPSAERSAASPTTVLPRALWRWLTDVAFFHPSDCVGSAAIGCLERILGGMPPLQRLDNACGLSSDEDESAARWDPARPLDYATVCRVLCCLGLDPTADDPSGSSLPKPADSSTSREAAAEAAEGGAGATARAAQEAAAAPRAAEVTTDDATVRGEVAQGGDSCCPGLGLASPCAPTEAKRLYPARRLARVLGFFAACVGSGRYALDADEALDFVCCLVATGADCLALATPGFAQARDALVLALLSRSELWGSSADNGTAATAAARNAGGGHNGGLAVSVWPHEATRRVSALVGRAGSPETKILLLRALPATGLASLVNSAGGSVAAAAAARAQRLVAFAAANYADAAFPRRASSPADAVCLDEDDEEGEEGDGEDEQSGNGARATEHAGHGQGGGRCEVGGGTGLEGDDGDDDGEAARARAHRCALRLLREHCGCRAGGGGGGGGTTSEGPTGASSGGNSGGGRGGLRGFVKRELERSAAGFGGGVDHLRRLAAVLDVLIGVASSDRERGEFVSAELSALFLSLLQEVNSQVRVTMEEDVCACKEFVSNLESKYKPFASDDGAGEGGGSKGFGEAKQQAKITTMFAKHPP